MKPIQSVLVLVAAVALGCSSPVEPPVDTPVDPPVDDPLPNPDAIHQFVGETPLPDKQDVVVSRVVPTEDVWLFRVRYGPPQDCWSGCFYATALGLANGEKIGWFDIDSYSASDATGIPLYAFDAYDANIAATDLWPDLETHDWWFFRYAFLRRLALSEEVGTEPLAAVIATLSSFIDGFLAQACLANAIVRSDCALLESLADLPVHPDYTAVVQEAQMLLQDCGRP